MQKKYKYAFRQKKVMSVQEAFTLFLTKKGGEDRVQLNALWEHWNIVMGEDIASLGFPLGHKETVLQVGADDTMALQELSMLSVEILERANAFMDKEFFTSLKVHLMQGKRSLSQPKRFARPSKAVYPLPPRPAQLGGLIGKLDPDSPIGKCYEAYVRLFDGK